MKLKSILKYSFAAAAMLTIAESASAKGTFTLKGNIEELPDSMKVYVLEVGDPNDRNATFAKESPKGGTFALTGEILRPGMAKLAFAAYNTETEDDRIVFSVPFFIEATDYTVSTPMNYADVRKAVRSGDESAVTVKGGKAQDEYLQYCAEIKDVKERAEQAAFKSASKYFETNNNKDTMRKYDAIKLATAKELLDAQRKFIRTNPKYDISSYLTQQELVKTFTYTTPEIEEMAAVVAVNPDTAVPNRNDRFLRFAKRYALNEEIRNFAVTDPDGKVVKLSEIKEPGKYTFMDLWASWCGPFRAAIPHVMEMAEKYGDKLKVVSVSVDEDDAAWRKAMEEENMSWSQFHAVGDQMNELSNIFFLQSIPRLVVLDPEGRIICSTFSPDVVSDCLSERLK